MGDWRGDRDSEVTGPEPEAVKDAVEEVEEPRRRSPRKQLPTSLPVEQPQLEPTRTEAVDSETETEVPKDNGKVHVRRSSRNKHHKSKTKHHKVKRKKRKHSKSLEDQALERVDKAGVVAPLLDREISKDSIESGKEDAICNENSPSTRNNCEVDLKRPKTEDVDKVEFVNDVNRADAEISCKELNDAKEKVSIVNNGKKKVPLSTTDQDSRDLVVSNQPKDAYKKGQGNFNDSDTDFLTDHQAGDEEEMPLERNVNETPSEERKIRKKRKRIRYEANEAGGGKSSLESTAEEHAHKHRKKKHKHTGEHKNKKHHDVRKAPQNGIVAREQGPEPISVIANSPTIVPDSTSVESNVENSLTEPQRVAIKIKLCQECSSRHLQDACPLLEPQYAISDTTSYENWLKKHNDNPEVQKTVDSNDPMSEGYDKPSEDGFESDDEQSNSEQSKQNIKVESEDKQLVVDKDRPIYARDSLPDCLELKVTSHDHGLGVYAKNQVPMYAKLGPLVGIPVKEMDIPDDFSMRHIWEVSKRFH